VVAHIRADRRPVVRLGQRALAPIKGLAAHARRSLRVTSPGGASAAGRAFGGPR
jgi:hypothetical protein